MSHSAEPESRFREHLRRQLEQLQNSASLYDAGQHHEAARIATTIRILIHDTRRSVSLLTHLGAKASTKLGSVAEPEPIPRNVVVQQVLALPGQRPGRVRVACYLPAEEWWNQIVHVHGPERRSRGDIVLFAANQDGGAHVDGELVLYGAQLAQGIWTKISRDPAGGKTRSERLTEHHLAMLRGMAAELLASPGLLALAATSPEEPGDSEPG